MEQETITCDNGHTFTVKEMDEAPSGAEFHGGERIPFGACPHCNWWVGLDSMPLTALDWEQRLQALAPRLLVGVQAGHDALTDSYLGEDGGEREAPTVDLLQSLLDLARAGKTLIPPTGLPRELQVVQDTRRPEQRAHAPNRVFLIDEQDLPSWFCDAYEPQVPVQSPRDVLEHIQRHVHPEMLRRDARGLTIQGTSLTRNGPACLLVTGDPGFLSTVAALLCSANDPRVPLVQCLATVPIWETILWHDHGHGHRWEDVRDWLWDQAVADLEILEENLEHGLSDYDLIHFDQEAQTFTFRLAIETCT